MSAVAEKIVKIRQEYGSKLLILGHHYQRPSVLAHADEIGDSLELARMAAGHPEAERIVFCGVRFMAESADILTHSDQRVYMPDMQAGCPMADMADTEAMARAWEILAVHGAWLPVVYVNSTAQIKALCGQLGGSTCTSSNAARVFKWVLDQGKKVFFLPDEHLGVNTARDLGFSPNDVAVFDPAQPDGGLHAGNLDSAKIVVWKGYCLVHTAFTAGHVHEIRERIPCARIIVHPEAPREVVELCDAHGSTSQIVKYVESAADGDTIVIGTELNLVERLAAEHAPRLNVKALTPSVCANMARTNESSLLELLEKWPEENEVHVDQVVAREASKALNRMLSL